MGVYGRGRPKRWNPFTNEGSTPPDAPGEYRVRDTSGKIAYVGETNNLRRRIKEHKSRGKLKELGEGTVDWMRASDSSDSSSRREHERRSIRKHKPRLNKSRGGEGRPAVTMTPSYDVTESYKPKRDPFGCVLTLVKWAFIIVAICVALSLLL